MVSDDLELNNRGMCRCTPNGKKKLQTGVEKSIREMEAMSVVAVGSRS